MIHVGTMAVPAAVVARKRRAIINAFREAGATHRDGAKTLQQVGLPPSLLSEVMKLRRVLVEVEGGRFYVDLERERAVSEARLKVIAALVVAAAVVLFVLLRRVG